MRELTDSPMIEWREALESRRDDGDEIHGGGSIGEGGYSVDKNREVNDLN